MYGYDDDGERFAYFQKAVIEMLNQLNYWPQIIHCHDWHTGMIPCMCKEGHSFDERYRNIRHVYTIHNMAYQGNFGVECWTAAWVWDIICLTMAMCVMTAASAS